MRFAWVVVGLIGCSSPSPAPTCEATANHLRGVYDQQDTREPTYATALRHCERVPWDDAVRFCVVRSNTPRDVDNCLDALPTAYRGSYYADVENAKYAYARARAEREAPVVRAATAERDDTIDGLPSSCDRYRRAIEQLAACDKLPDQTKQALHQAFRDQRAAWSMVPVDQRDKLEAGCITAAEAVEQSSAMCN